MDREVVRLGGNLEPPRSLGLEMAEEFGGEPLAQARGAIARLEGDEQQFHPRTLGPSFSAR